MTLLTHLGPALVVGSVVVEPEIPTDTPVRLTRGLMSRDRSRMVTGDGSTPNALGQLVIAGVGGSCALEFPVGPMYLRNATTGATSLAAGPLQALIDDLDWCESLGILGLLRPMYGYHAPSWLKELAGGGMPWYTNDGGISGPAAPSDPTQTWRLMPNPMLRWWTDVAVDHYGDFLDLLFAVPAVRDHPALAGVCFSGTMTQYAEPGIKKLGVQENRDQLLNSFTGTTAERAAKYNLADEVAMFAGFEAHATYCSPHRIATYCSYNHTDQLNAQGGRTSSGPQAIHEMEEQVRILGKMAVLENNSFRNPLYQQAQMYAHQLAQRDRTEPFPVPLHYQTQTNVKLEASWDAQPAGGKITTPFSTVELALERRANSVELANGSEKASWTGAVGTSTQRWPAMTTTEAAAYNAAFRDVGLYV